MILETVQRLEEQLDLLLQRQRTLQAECAVLRQEREQLRAELDRILGKVERLLQDRP